jgi:uncharacterized iron-regulated protein
MRASDPLSLQLSLHRRQQREIREALSGQSPALSAYERRYKRATARFEGITTLEAVKNAVRAADVVLVGDYHTLPAAQATFLDLVQHALKSPRRIVLGVEFLESRYQPLLDKYLRHRASEDSLVAKSAMAPFWDGFRPLFELARKRRLEVIAIDSRPPGTNTLRRRDVHAATRMVEAARAPDSPRVLALMGQFHIAPGHLPKELTALAPELKQLSVYQNCESIHWTLAKQRMAESVDAVKLSATELCLLHTSPVECQRSFLEYLDSALTA